jgi:hypothetical protein
MSDQNRLAGFSILFGAMLLAVAASGTVFLFSNMLPAYVSIVLPAVLGAGLLTAGLLSRWDNRWSDRQGPPSHGS